jgi:phosphate transport system ATP-binding protein
VHNVGTDAGNHDVVFEITALEVWYGAVHALKDVNMVVRAREVLALIGPSGCGKSTFVRTLNRMNDLIPLARVEGTVAYHGQDIYARKVDPIEVRRRIGMVFQRPNPFPKSIYDNVAFGLRINGVRRSDMDDIVEASLRRAALWDEVSTVLNRSALSLSGGQQQRLCIARAIAIRPDVLLMDEPCSALDPLATQRIENLIEELKGDYAIVIVTHNLQQASRVSDRTAFFTVDQPDGDKAGVLVEVGDASTIFSTPTDPRTEAYISGRFG